MVVRGKRCETEESEQKRSPHCNEKSFAAKGENSCMSTALNFYFNVKAFEDINIFSVVQTEYLSLDVGRTPKLLSGKLMSGVCIDKKHYRRKLVWDDKFHLLALFPIEIKTRDGRCIVDFIDDNKSTKGILRLRLL